MRPPLTDRPIAVGRPRFGLVLLLLLLSCGVALLSAWLGGAYGSVKTFTLPPSTITYQEGCAYLIRTLPSPGGWPLAEFVGDTRASAPSRLVLTENGWPLPNPHALDTEIRSSGPGGYSHWRRSLLFSTPDCSDPRTNGRRYEVAVPWSPSGLTYVLAFLVWSTAGFALRGICSGDAAGTLWCRASRRAFELLLGAADLMRRPRLATVAALAILIGCWGTLAWGWSQGWSTGLSLAGFFPTSDASGYWRCANYLLDNGRFFDAWCERRALYPAWLAGLNLIGGRHLLVTLVLQALVVAAAIFVLVRRLSPQVPGAATLVCAGLLVAYGSCDLFPLTMTENAGVIFGALALALLLRAADELSLAWLAGGAAMLSLALNARAGAFFVLPALVLWAGVVARVHRRPVRRWMAVTALAVLIGFGLQAGLVLATGGDPGASQGNFAYTLYGLSVGGKGWQQVLLDHPEVVSLGNDAAHSRAIYALAWENLTTRPAAFFEGLAQGWDAYLTGGTYGYYRLGAAAPLARCLWWLAWLPLFWMYRNPRYLLIALLSLGIAASAPWLIGDGGPRIFAATVAVDAIQIAIGLAVVLNLVVWLAAFNRGDTLPVADQAPPVRRCILEPTVTFVALVVLLLPHTPLARLVRQPPVLFNGCAQDEAAVATRINRGGNVSLSIVADGHSVAFLRGEIARESLLRGIARETWWRPDLLAFTGGSLFSAYQLRADDPVKHFFGYADATLARYDGQLVGLCLDRRDSKMMFGLPHFRLNSVTELE